MNSPQTKPAVRTEPWSWIMRTFCVLTDASQLAEFNDEYINWFPGNKPARTTIVAGLVGPFRFEIEAPALKIKG